MRWSTFVAARPGGELLAVASDDGRVVVWAPAENRVVAEQRSDGFVNRLGWTHDGSHLLVTTNRDAILVLSGDGARLESTIETGQGGLRTFGVHPREPAVASIGPDGVARVWDVTSGAKRVEAGTGKPAGTSVALTERAIVCGYQSGWFEAWDHRGDNLAGGEIFAASVSAIAAAPGGKSFVLGGSGGRMLELVDDGGSYRARNVWRSHPPKGVSTNAIDFAADGRFVAAHSDDTACVFDSTRQIAGRNLGSPFWVGGRTPWEQKHIVSAACFVPGTPLVATSHFTGAVKLWGPRYGVLTVRFDGAAPAWTDSAGALVADPIAAFGDLTAQ